MAFQSASETGGGPGNGLDPPPAHAMATPMTPERFQDRWEAFKGEPQQVSGIWGLYRLIAELEGSGDIFNEQAS